MGCGARQLIWGSLPLGCMLSHVLPSPHSRAAPSRPRPRCTISSQLKSGDRAALMAFTIVLGAVTPCASSERLSASLTPMLRGEGGGRGRAGCATRASAGFALQVDNIAHQAGLQAANARQAAQARARTKAARGRAGACSGLQPPTARDPAAATAAEGSMGFGQAAGRPAAARNEPRSRRPKPAEHQLMRTPTSGAASGCAHFECPSMRASPCWLQRRFPATLWVRPPHPTCPRARNSASDLSHSSTMSAEKAVLTSSARCSRGLWGAPRGGRRRGRGAQRRRPHAAAGARTAAQRRTAALLTGQPCQSLGTMGASSKAALALPCGPAGNPAAPHLHSHSHPPAPPGQKRGSFWRPTPGRTACPRCP